MIRSAAFTAAVAMLACLVGSCESRRPARPSYSCPDCNIVLVSLDTLRADHVGAYGYPRSTTPNIDALAASGVLFEHVVSQSSWTRPAHMSMFTGLYPAEHGIVGIGDRKRLPDSVPTVAEIFRKHGYRTAAFTGGVNVAAFFGFDKGFELFRNNGTHLRDNLEELRYWLDQHREEKFFLFAHGYEPHGPYQSDAIDRVALGQRDAPSTRKLRRACEGESKRRRIIPFVRAYDAAIHRGDRYVGQLLSHLDEIGIRDKTVVLFLSDHGEEFLEHGGCFHLRTLHREVLEVPFIIAGPRITHRRVTALLPGSVSVGATLLDLAGIGAHDLPGPSLAGWIYGQGPSFDKIVSETARPARAPQVAVSIRAVSTTTEKLIADLDDGSWRYFNLLQDPGELDGRRSGKEAQTLASWLETWSTEHSRRIEGADSAPLPGDLAEELQRLGYFN